MVSISISKDMFEPSYDDLKFMIWSHNYVCTNLNSSSYCIYLYLKYKAICMWPKDPYNFFPMFLIFILVLSFFSDPEQNSFCFLYSDYMLKDMEMYGTCVITEWNYHV